MSVSYPATLSRNVGEGAPASIRIWIDACHFERVDNEVMKLKPELIAFLGKDVTLTMG